MTKFIIKGAWLFTKIFSVILVIIAIFLWLIYNGHLLDVPSKTQLKDFKLAQRSEIYTQDGLLIGRIYSQNRRCIEYSEIPQKLINGLIAVEDNRYYSHHGIDFIGVLRAGVKTVLLGENAGGGSTLSQQLVKNWYPRKSFETNSLMLHKIREWITAIKLEQVYSKNKILELYLNTVSFGHNRFGVFTASQYYFNKAPNELKPHQMATLIALLKGNTQFDPEKKPNACLKRRNLVLKIMHQQGCLSKKEYEGSITAPLLIQQGDNTHEYLAPHFVQFVKSNIAKELNSISGNNSILFNPQTDGLKIYTTLNSTLQEYAIEALTQHLDSLQTMFNAEWSERRWSKERDVLIKLIRIKRYAGGKQLASALLDGNSLTIEQKKLLGRIKKDLTRLRAGFTCIQNSGEVLAWVGGRDFSYSQFDHVKSTRQVGSVFKPIVYATAVDQGVNLCNYFKNERKSYHSFHDWQPRNAGNRYQGYYTMKGALTFSLNVISVQVMLRAGLLDVLNVARQMGIETNIPVVPSISLGTPDISLFEMVNAYTCFPNNGVRIQTRFLHKVYNQQNKLVWSNRPQISKKVFSIDVAAIMTNMMESVVNNGTGKSLRTDYKLTGPIAGKTGTSQNQSDGWFVAYTPQFTAGAWVGADSPEIHFESLETGAGAKTALPVWAGFARSIQNNPKYSYLLKGNFTFPSQRALNCLNQPMYRDKLP